MYTCRDCGEEFERGDVYFLEDTGDYVCGDCIDRGSYGYCDNCGCRFSEDYYMHWDGDCSYCDSCYDNMQDYDGDIIRGYHDRDIPINFKYLDSELKEGITKDDLLYFGWESEVYNDKRRISNGEMAYLIREKYPELEFVFEHDGSIGDSEDDGFEMISQPSTMPFIKENKTKYEDIYQMLIDNGFTAHNNPYCGLHIHFSRNYFKDNEDKYIQKLTLFFETFKDELKNFSRRKDFYWCEFIGDKCHYDKRYLKSSVVLKDFAKNNSSHNIAINLGNRNTIEIRIFKGTLKFETLMASLELVDSLVRTIKTKETRKISFDNVVNMSGNEYIQAYCELRNIYNSQHLNDETKNVMKELETKKNKYESIKEQCKKDMTDTLQELSDIAKETTQTIDLNNEDLSFTFNILSQVNNVLCNRINDVKCSVFDKNDKKIEECYENYISNNNDYNPIEYYKQLLKSVNYIITDNWFECEIKTKLQSLYDTAKAKLDKLNSLLTNNNASVEGEE